MKRVILFTVSLIVIFLSTVQVQKSDVFKVVLEINGFKSSDSILCFKQNNYYSADVKQLMDAVGGEFYPFTDKFNISGFATQYGKIISYARDSFSTGFYKSIPIEMQPYAQKKVYNNDTLVQFAPINFLSKAIGGTVYYDEKLKLLRVIKIAADTIGSIVPQAAALAKSFQKSKYYVRQAGIDHTNAITVCNAGYTPDCNGNNAGFPYLVINMPPSESFDSLYNIPSLYNLRDDEAIIIIGKTPPRCKYFSYRSYIVSRFCSYPSVTRKKLYASLGDANSCYSMWENEPTDKMFERDFAIISAADSLTLYKSKQLILENTTIPEGDIYFDIMASDMYRFGFSINADWGSFLHRASIFEDSIAGNKYVNQPTLEVLRITPKTYKKPVYISNIPLKPRITGNDEFYLNDDFKRLEYQLFKEYNSDFEVSFLEPRVWLMEGYQAMQETENVLGEVRDALYIRTESFNFNEDDIIVVYGVNHVKTGKSVYTNVSCYRDLLFGGYGGIKNTQYEKTARSYFADTIKADNFFIYKFARKSIANGSNVFIVPQDTDNNLLGINYGDRAFIAFRAYIDTISKVGPSPQEIIFSRAMLLRKKGSAFADIKKYD